MKNKNHIKDQALQFLGRRAFQNGSSICFYVNRKYCPPESAVEVQWMKKKGLIVREVERWFTQSHTFYKLTDKGLAFAARGGCFKVEPQIDQRTYGNRWYERRVLEKIYQFRSERVRSHS